MRTNTLSDTTNDRYTRKEDTLLLYYLILNQSFRRLFVRPPDILTHGPPPYAPASWQDSDVQSAQ